jgi:hypothetical protein
VFLGLHDWKGRWIKILKKNNELIQCVNFYPESCFKSALHSPFKVNAARLQSKNEAENMVTDTNQTPNLTNSTTIHMKKILAIFTYVMSICVLVLNTTYAQSSTEMQNPEVQMVLTSSRPNSWADAQKKAVTQVKDGDPLWIYLKTAKPMREYVFHNQDDPKLSTGQLNLVIAPRGTYTSLSRRHKGEESTWPLRIEEMGATEIAIGLSPPGARAFKIPNGSSPSGKADFFLRMVAGNNSEPGLWETEIFVIGNKQHVDAMGKVDPTVIRQTPMAVVPITVDVSSSFKKYEAMRTEDCSLWPGGKAKQCKGKQ